MFETALLDSSRRQSSVPRRINYVLAYVAESIVVGVLILMPLIHTQALPSQLLITGVHISPLPGPPPARITEQTTPPPRRHSMNSLVEPTIIPVAIAQIVETPEPPQTASLLTGPFVPGVPGELGPGSGYFPGSVLAGTNPPPPPPPQTHSAPRQQMVRRGGDLIAAMALYQPRPLYPSLAITAHIQGLVVLEAILSKDGTVKDLKVLSGHPLLVPAALAAVKTWRYQPTLLNSETVEVLTEIDVNFKLGE